jgi:hypothetical protein
MTTVTLIPQNGMLYFPTGENFGDPTKPSLLIHRYEAGDCDTCQWPMTREKDRVILASALYAERECNATFPARATILLPDGTPFDFDALVS